MYLARVIGQVVSTKKEDTLKGRKLLLLRPQLVDNDDPSRFKPGSNTVVAVDAIGAGEGDMVLFVQGSSARQAEGFKTLPVDAAVTGIVDKVHVEHKSIYSSGENT